METLQSMGDQFLALVKQIIGDNIDNEHFTVSILANEVGLSRSMMHRKLIRLTGKSATALITELRLERAWELLEKDVATVSEIAYMVGFTSPSYFTKVFKKTYQIPPGEVRKKGLGKRQSILNSVRKKRMTWRFASMISFMIIAIMTALLILLNTNKGEGSDERQKSIAVLPFKNISPDSSNQYILDGIMEAVLDYLTKVENLRAIASTSVQQYRETTKPISVIGEELNVNYILEGSGQKYDENFRLTTKLSEVKSNTLIWSNPYNREIKDILDVQSEIAQKIVNELQLELTSEDRDELIRRPTFSDKAYQNYLITVKFWEIGIPRAIELLEEAIEIDPQFVEAYITLSTVHMARVTMYGDNTSWEEVKELAMLPLKKALEIDPNHPDALNAMGNFRYWIEWDFNGAEDEFLKATELSGLFYLNYVNLLIQNKRYVEALEVSLKLKDYNPVNSNYGMMLSYLFLGEYQKAMEQAIGNDGWSGRIYMAMHDYHQAILIFENLIRNWRTPFFMSDLAICYYRIGNKDLANEILYELIERYNQGEGGSIAFMVGKIYTEKGEIEPALEWLEKSYLNHELEMVWLYAEPAFEVLQDNEQYIDLLKKVGFDV